MVDRAEGERKLAAILSADVAGYSRLMGADEEATVAELNQCRALFKDKIAAHKGRVVDTAGDSVLAEFPSVVEAVRTAVEVQEALKRRNDDLPEDRRMLFRIGVNLGDVIEQADGSIYGDGVNVAARLEGLAESGGITVSEDAYRQVEGKTDLGFQDIGEHEVKNIAKPVRAYRVTAENVLGKTTATEAPLALPDKPSIAVLPFTNLGGDPEQEYFADGIAEDLITALSRIRWLFVTARNSTFTYKGKAVDVKQVGREMGVRYVLEGSVRKGGNRVRISAQLIDATTGNHVWAERYDRELADLFDLQDEITETIVGAIEPELGEVERERAMRKPPDSLEAWDYYQRGMWHMWQFSKDDNTEAQRLLEKAVAIDPRFGTVYGGLAYSRFFHFVFGYADDPPASLEGARVAALKAIAIDEKDAMGHCALARVHTASGDLAAAISESETAIALSPSFALAHYALGVALCMSGRPAEAIPEYEAAARLSPHDPYISFFIHNIGVAYLNLKQDERAIEFAKKAIQHPNATFWAYAVLASALGNLGRIEEARPVLDKLLELKPDFSRKFFNSVWVGVDPSSWAHYFEGLYKAGLDNSDDPSSAD